MATTPFDLFAAGQLAEEQLIAAQNDSFYAAMIFGALLHHQQHAQPAGSSAQLLTTINPDAVATAEYEDDCLCMWRFGVAGLFKPSLIYKDITGLDISDFRTASDRVKAAKKLRRRLDNPAIFGHPADVPKSFSTTIGNQVVTIPLYRDPAALRAEFDKNFPPPAPSHKRKRSTTTKNNKRAKLSE